MPLAPTSATHTTIDKDEGGEVQNLKVLFALSETHGAHRALRQSIVASMLALSASLLPHSALAQTCGFLGERQVKSYWFEGTVGMVIVPSEVFANPSSCLRSDQTFVLASNPQYKNIVAAVVHSMSTGVPVQAYTCGCHTYWSNLSWPIAVAFGVGGAPR